MASNQELDLIVTLAVKLYSGTFALK